MKNSIIAALAAYIVAHMDFWTCSPKQVAIWLFIGILAAVQCLDWKIEEWREGSEENERKHHVDYDLQRNSDHGACGFHDHDRLCG